MKSVPVEIRVLEKHINDGVRGGCEDCPVALAILAALKPGFFAHVMSDNVQIQTEYGTPVANRVLPKNARLFIQRFDWPTFPKPEPFCFTLKLPPEVVP